MLKNVWNCVFGLLHLLILSLYLGATEKKIVKYSSWAACALYLALLVVSIFAFKVVIPHYPKCIMFMILWFIGFAMYVVQILCSSFHFFLRYSSDINILTCAIDYLLTPYIQFFFFVFFSYIVHHKSFIITFFPPSSVCLDSFFICKRKSWCLV